MKSHEQKRREGDERNAAWREMSPAEQMNSLMARRGNSLRQIARLQKAIEKKFPALKAEGDALLASMQTPEARKAMDKLFTATPQELGAAAVEYARKQRKKK